MLPTENKMFKEKGEGRFLIRNSASKKIMEQNL